MLQLMLWDEQDGGAACGMMTWRGYPSVPAHTRRLLRCAALLNSLLLDPAAQTSCHRCLTLPCHPTHHLS